MIPIADQLVNLVIGSPGQGKTTLLTHLAANGPPGTWMMSWDDHIGLLTNRMLRLGRTQGIELFSAPLNVADLIEKQRPPMVVLDAIDQMLFDLPTPRALDVVKGIVQVCRRINTRLILGMSRRRGSPPDSTANDGLLTLSDTVWSFTDVLKVRCVKGRDEGFECQVDLIIPQTELNPPCVRDLDAGWLYIPTTWERLCED